MNTAPFDTSVPDGAINRSARWLKVIRVGTLLMIFSLGGCYLLIGFWGFLMNGPFEPETGVSFQEHFRRMHTGYYRLWTFIMMAKMACYLAIVALPYRWILRSRARFFIVFTVLCVAFSLRPFSLMSDLISNFGNQTELINRLSWLPVDVFVLLYFAAAPVSLYLAWKYGRNAG